MGGGHSALLLDWVVLSRFGGPDGTASPNAVHAVEDRGLSQGRQSQSWLALGGI